MKNAIITVSDKTNIEKIGLFLIENNFNIYSTGGTYKYLMENIDETYHKYIIDIPNLTGFPEILNGRVKTLHPKIYGGLLADVDNIEHIKDIKNNKLIIFSVVIVNLYPFVKNNCIENIDIGGVSLIRASSKNYKHVSILTELKQYNLFMDYYKLIKEDKNKNIKENFNLSLARRGFKLTSEYDNLIYEYLNK